MTAPLHFVLPGPLDAASGGTVYDRRIVEGLRAEGRAVETVSLPGAYPWPDAAARRAAEEAFARMPDGGLAVVDGLAFGALPDVAARHGDRLRLIALVHHPLAEETGLSEAEVRRLARSETEALAHARGAITSSPFTVRRLAAAYGMPVDAIRAVTPGTDPVPPAEGGGTPGIAQLLCVASYIPRKGHGDLLRALARLDRGDWHLRCIGRDDIDPATTDAVHALRDSLGLAARVTLSGPVDGPTLERAYAAADLFVLPSHYEGYGMVVTEAVARGLPVVTTTGGALADTLPEGAGLAVPPGDVEALTEALATVLASTGRREALAAGARRARAALPDWTDAAQAFAAALDDLAGDGR